MGMEYKSEQLSPVRSLISVSGRITAVNAGKLKEVVKELVSTGTKEIVFDLSGVSFLDSSGLAAFVSTLKATGEAGGWMKIAGLPELPASIFELTMLDRVIDLYPDVGTALASAAD